MNAASPDVRITRLQLGLVLAVLLVTSGWILDATLRNPDIPFLTETDGPHWIGVYAAVDSNAIRVDQKQVPVFTFVKRFDLDVVPPAAELWARAATDADFFLNDVPLLPRPVASWKEAYVVPVAAQLQGGRNEIRVNVRNGRGPALLQLRIRAGDAEGDRDALLETNATWAAYGPRGRRLPTMRADDTRLHPQSFSLPATNTLLGSHAVPLALFFALGALLSAALPRSLSPAARARAPECVLGFATLFWVAVYTTRSSQLPVLMGFDIVGHLEYIDLLLAGGPLPLATDGWSTYHPPLAHWLTSVVAGGFERESAAARWLYRLPTFAAGLGNVWVVYFAARRLFERDPLRTSLAVGFAAVLPMNVYLSAYVANEPLHSFLVSASLLLACSLLLQREAPLGRVAALAATLGLAILTKFTALIAVPIAAFFLAVKLWLVDAARAPRIAGVTALLLGGVAAIGGWFYVRNQVLLGQPLVGNWNLPGNLVWWEQPGFHTAGYYTSFGQSLSQPFFAGYHSFWDGLYSTFWGDGLVAGMIHLSTRHSAWNYDFMTLGYWLAFPATLLLGLGFARIVRESLRDGNGGRRLALTLLLAYLVAAALALFTITLRLPYYAQAKAFYALSAIVPISVIAAAGLAWLPERLAEPAWWPVRLLYFGWLGSLTGTLVLSFLG